MADDATLAPNFTIVVNGTELQHGITQFVQKLEYESCDGLADVARVNAINPDFLLSNAKVFQPGNEMDIWMGYGPNTKHIGRVIIARVRPSWPQNGMPVINVVGYTKDVKMMDHAPEKSKKTEGKGGRIFEKAKFSEIVEDKASDPTYGFTLDVDTTDDEPRSRIQKIGLSDYDFVRGLANLTGSYFWVDGDQNGVWTLHFKAGDFTEQVDKFTFKYNIGDLSSLLSFTPELLLQNSQTKIKAQTTNAKNGKNLKAEFEEESNAAPDVEVSGDPEAELDADHTTASDVKIFLGDFSIEVVTNRQFTTEAELTAWVKQWFRRQRENFVLARGRIIGVETMRARQVHGIEGIASGLDGDYFFSKVKHILDKSSGYTIDFHARKVVP